MTSPFFTSSCGESTQRADSTSHMVCPRAGSYCWLGWGLRPVAGESDHQAVISINSLCAMLAIITPALPTFVAH
jgi:hypothetical protein